MLTPSQRRKEHADTGCAKASADLVRNVNSSTLKKKKHQKKNKNPKTAGIGPETNNAGLGPDVASTILEPSM